MHLSMVCPRNPREFDFMKLSLGGDFDIHDGPVGWVGILIFTMDRGNLIPSPAWNVERAWGRALRHLGTRPRSRWDAFFAAPSSSFRT